MPKAQVPDSDATGTIDFKTIENLQQAGFTGFVSIASLWQDSSAIPRIKGVYMVVCPSNTAPEFLSVGTGGFFKDKDSNVPISELQAIWVNDTCVIYVGQAGGIRGGKQSSATLQSRLRQYLQFGQGKAVGHQGGCYIWQLKDAANLLLCWKPLPIDDPRAVEKELIAAFKTRYGRYPFANRQD